MISITIDGEAASGKSFVAELLSKKINYIHLETGIIYRAITLYAIENQVIDNNNFDTEAIKKSLENINLEFQTDEKKKIHFILNAKYLGDNIREKKVSDIVPKISELDFVREFVNKKQYEITNDAKGFVIEGRDSGSVVFPKADLKIFIKADLKHRALRRYNQLKRKGIQYKYQEVMEDLKKRDFIDKNRELAPLIIPDDAVIIDNTNINIEDLLNNILKIVNEKQLLI